MSLAGPVLGAAALAAVARGYAASSAEERKWRARMNQVKHAGPDDLLGAGFKSLTDQVASRVLGPPLDAFQRLIRGQVVDNPRAKATLHHLTQHDPIISRAYAENPDKVHEAFSTLREFSPGMAGNSMAARGFLRHAVTTDNALDPATLRLLTESEKIYRESRRGGGK